jgi:hypothetical protein
MRGPLTNPRGGQPGGRGQVDLRHCAGWKCGANLHAGRNSTLRRGPRRGRASRRYRACALGASCSPSNHSWKAILFTIRVPPSTRRLSPHAEHVKFRGKLSTIASPTWPHGHETRTIISVAPQSGAKRHKPPLRSKALQCLRIVPELEIAAAFSISMT